MGRLFGTDGVRGVANTELTCTLAYNLARAAAVVLTEHTHDHPTIVIGKDTRISSDMLEAAMVGGFCSVGANVLRLGYLPTPAVAFLVGKYHVDAGVVISASHNSFEYNGIKFFGGDGYKLSDAMEDEIAEIALSDTFPGKEKSGSEIGRVSDYPQAIDDYIDHLLSVAPCRLDGLKVAIDAANGASSACAGRLFRELGAEVLLYGADPDGVNINAGCGSTHPETLCQAVVSHGCDAGVAFDGDADRCIAVDEQGQLVNGDKLMAMIAYDLKQKGKLDQDTLVITTMSNLGLFKMCEKHGIATSVTAVGDRYVLEEMRKCGYNLGGEQSGHIILSEFASTGDGELSALMYLSIIKQSGKKASELAGIMQTYPQVHTSLHATGEQKDKFHEDPKIAASIRRYNDELGTNGRVVVRPSGTEAIIRIMVEGQDEEEIKRIAAQIKQVIEQRIS